MTTVAVQIDQTLLTQLVKQGIIEVMEAGIDLVITAGKRLTAPKKLSQTEFDIFWSRYPRKVGRRAAKIAWDKALKRGAHIHEILNGLNEHALAAKDKQYIVHPSRWINEERWLDQEDNRTIHDDMREQLLNDYKSTGTDAIGSNTSQRLPSVIPHTRAISYERSEDAEDKTNSGIYKSNDSIWTD